MKPKETRPFGGTLLFQSKDWASKVYKSSEVFATRAFQTLAGGCSMRNASCQSGSACAVRFSIVTSA
jgi:hypothetical protein